MEQAGAALAGTKACRNIRRPLIVQLHQSAPFGRLAGYEDTLIGSRTIPRLTYRG
ncbi:hypothetical protein FBZ93_11185 [Bradyrhizobium macuxiense]|uniref:Uncharacterized protein n=1 Tax=Bradyrhizobium macuxiense TaxID=1755647 RepID=A0A560LBU0_9BRAD|nr:hypothetical protein FBZ93_11185 [Bradyrhizobium macuxiense]